MGQVADAGGVSERLRARGLRVTAQRRRVLEAVAELGHATPEQIQVATGSVDLSTVYRTLDVLQDIGLVQHTHLGHGSPTWSLAETDTHLHLVCDGCHAVVEVPADSVEPLRAQLERDHGFALDLGHLSLAGKCGQCRTHADETT